jgi:hypothetical protein
MYQGIENKRFIMKYGFYEPDIKKDAIVRFITCINYMCLVEDIETKERAWVSRIDIKPVIKDPFYNDDYWG